MIYFMIKFRRRLFIILFISEKKMRDVDPRLLLDPIVELCLPKIWQWTDYNPTIPGYWDMICDFIALVTVRLINGTEKISQTTRNKPMNIRKYIFYN